jgi:acyl phosphate:glycerol-3-phosphate acyltransferase
VDVPSLLRAIAVIAAAFVIGGIPWGVIVARLSGGPDPRTVGSGRTGGSNVMRALGPRLALLSGLLDAAKGSVAVLLAWWVGGGDALAVVAALAAVIGHSRSVFLGFHGGRGIAPSWGALLVLQPWIALAIIPLFAGVILVTRYSSLGSLTASAAAGILLAITTYVVPLSPWMYVYAVGGVVLIFAFHADNIQRLLSGKERKIGTPRAAPPPA